jgi:DNA-binding NtrC family response regulator
MKSAVIYIIDDDPHFSRHCSGLLGEREIASKAFESLDSAMSGSGPQVPPAAIILDWQLGTLDSLDELTRVQARFPTAPVILTTAAPTTSLVVRAIKAGIFDFLVKPLLDEARLYATVSKAISHGRLLARVDALNGGHQSRTLLGESAAMQSVHDTLRMASPTDATLLILGESGTGKEVAAREAHALSGRTGEMVCVNMAALPREMVESTLFGSERGAFTGADKQRTGLCEQAADGTLFFDEIGELPLDLQAKLLRFLQERSFRRVGGTEEVRVDTRIIAATNRDLFEEVNEGRFRPNLFYRLNTIPIEMPPLRDRPDDIPPLAMSFLREFAARYGRQFKSFSTDALAALSSNRWPGNVRELRQAIERVVVLHDAPEVSVEMLPRVMATTPVASSSDRVPAAPLTASKSTVEQPSAGAKESQTSEFQISSVIGEEIIPLADLEMKMIQLAMAKANGSAREAARMLGISLATLYRRIKP